MSDLVEVYFGLGCFWHLQHEFIMAERDILNRSDAELTAVVGYAGGTEIGLNGQVCYYAGGSESLGYYAPLGHGEVVNMKIPKDKFKDFATVYFDNFVNGDRKDWMDIGAEYRHLVGIPGGLNSDLYSLLEEAQNDSGNGITLKEGLGNDPDNLGDSSTWIMDSDDFPFFMGELYHQFHDDFLPGGYYE